MKDETFTNIKALSNKPYYYIIEDSIILFEQGLFELEDLLEIISALQKSYIFYQIDKMSYEELYEYVTIME